MTVAVYVPPGVPFAVIVGDDPPPPQPLDVTSKAKTNMGASARRRFLPRSSRPEAPKASVHPISQRVGCKSSNGLGIVLPAAVVVTVTVTAVAALPDTLTEPGTLQIGAGVTAGITLQARVTVPLNDPTGVSAKPNFAVPPAEIVDELEPPDAVPKVKSGAAIPVPLRLMVCGELNALSVI
jgi:hypothetical protein